MPDGRPTRVFVVDDHAVFVQGLLRLMTESDDLVACGVATTAEAAVEQAPTARPDVLLLDHRLPDGTGVELAQRLQPLLPGVPVVVLAGMVDDDLVIEANIAGCAAVLGKHSAFDEIVATVRSVANGSSGARGGGRVPFGLTARELEVLQAIGRGLTAAAMSAELHLSTHTARNYTQRVLDKLGVHSKAEAVAIAGRYGLLTPGPRTA